MCQNIQNKGLADSIGMDEAIGKWDKLSKVTSNNFMKVFVTNLRQTNFSFHAENLTNGKVVNICSGHK